MKNQTINGLQYDLLLSLYCTIGSGKIFYIKKERAILTANNINKSIQTLVIDKAQNKTVEYLHRFLSRHNITIKD
jgi:hypothetical protein